MRRTDPARAPRVDPPGAVLRRMPGPNSASSANTRRPAPRPQSWRAHRHPPRTRCARRAPPFDLLERIGEDRRHPTPSVKSCGGADEDLWEEAHAASGRDPWGSRASARQSDDAPLVGVGASRRVRDDLHVTANRVARFDVDERPTVNPVRARAPAAADATLAPEPLLFQVDLTAASLIALLDPLSAHDWARRGQWATGSRPLACSWTASRTSQLTTRSILCRTRRTPAEGVSAMTDAPMGARNRRNAYVARHSPEREVHRDAAES